VFAAQFTEQPASLKAGYVRCSSNKRISGSLVRQIRDDSIRKQIFEQAAEHPVSNRTTLGALVKTRFLLGINSRSIDYVSLNSLSLFSAAKKQGFKSFVDKYLANKCVKTTEDVQALLKQTAEVVCLSHA